MGLNPNTWGSQAWHFIHAVALAYPEKPTEKDKENYQKFIYSLPDVLPCVFCGVNFLEKLKTNPPKLDSREEFFKWTVDIHNMVNVKNGKPILSYEEAMKEFIKNSNKNENLEKNKKLENDKYKNILFYISIGLAIAILGINIKKILYGKN